MTLPIYDITPFTLLDFPGRMACIVWFSGCNMRCGYCHNPQIVKGKGNKPIADVLSFLEKRKNRLDGVVLSGGEASVWPGLATFIVQARAMGYAIKLDTNGLRPDIIQDFLDKGLLDYIALDYKAPPDKFKQVTGVSKFDDFSKTLSILCAQISVPFEIRTTVHTSLMNENDVNGIISDLDHRGYRGTYYVQNFRADNGRATLKYLPSQPYTLDISVLCPPKNFQMAFRNFDLCVKVPLAV